ncbi:MAG: hypothetical protein KJ970_13960 [Candidatus Eisenbacteria bacterium]|uniref:Uncharacterized protein n=1 Tax=Eiseniibacteriota bacterium TaxID=2212470 RepID=A0A948W7A4_UNCEI|nr:hypothetical protein [Candidatus Eisenbacteria bacterium]MBU1948647.1 hypothetical protein [Candidatus Eisenbacteria bacterium]MBU2692020.1 hypothetical protein [Candidatus Eisenbacteria bacterium]
MVLSQWGWGKRGWGAGRQARTLAAGFVVSAGLVLALGIFLAACSDDKGNGGTEPTIRHPQDFIPQGTSGMSLNGSVQVATNAEELQQVINGGYGVYLTYNFQELALQNYLGNVAGSQASLDVYIYDMGTAEDAADLHHDVEINGSGSYEELDDVGDEERLFIGLGWQKIQFLKGQYWVRIYIDSSTEDAKTLLDLFGTAVVDEIAG